MALPMQGSDDVAVTRQARWPGALATLLIIVLTCKALMAIDLVWDSLSYHMPFAALRAGLLTPAQFQFGSPARDPIGDFYKGFPIFADLVGGWMWRLTGWPEMINMLGIISIVALAGYLKWAFALPSGWVLLGLLAIPAVQTAVTGAYIDVPAGAIFTIFLFSICDLWARPDRFCRPAPWVVMFLGAFVAANIKLQTTVFVCLAMPLLLPPTWRLLRERRAGWRLILGTIGLGVLATGAVTINLIKNLIVYHNPFFPIGLKIFGFKFPSPLLDGMWLDTGRAYDRYPEWMRWFLSVFEFHALDGREVPYSNGMGNVPIAGLASSMGGFFAALVFASLSFFVLGILANRNKLAYSTLGIFLYFTVIVAFMPNAENLRYDVFWMMFLVVSCILLLRPAALSPYRESYQIMLISALVFVTSVTGGIYFIPRWNPAQNYVNFTGAEKLLDHVVQPGDTICLEQGPGHFDQRFTIIFSPLFHKALAEKYRYNVRQGDCDGFKTISSWR